MIFIIIFLLSGAVLTLRPPALAHGHITLGGEEEGSYTDMCIICIWWKTLLKHACLNPSALFYEDNTARQTHFQSRTPICAAL